MSLSRIVIALSAGITLFSLSGDASAEGRPGQESSGAVYVLSNQTTANSVLVYRRDSSGNLTYSGSFPTGGTGAGTGGDPLGSQGSLTLGSGLIFAVNAGSNDVSMFAVRGTDLVLLDRKPSGGQMPVSVAVNGFRVYVVNAGGTPNISGFAIDPVGGHLVPLPNSQRPLAGGTLAMPAEISFDADGDILLVSEKGTKLIDTYRLDFRGYASGPISHPSSGVTPFGFSVTNRGYAIVAEAGPGAASSYEIDRTADLELVSGSVALGQKAPCWLVTTHDGRYAYTANAGSGTISSLGIAPDGVLSLLNPAAATLSAPLDLAMTRNSKFLYVREGTGSVSGFKVGTDGSLTLVGTWTGLPAGAQGIAAR
jgi:6-phosphogluconolactonase